MERITVTIEPHVAAKLRREARWRHISLSELVRERIRDEEDERPQRSIPWAGIGASGNPKLATEFDAELERTWADDLRSKID
ncbi:MAG: ribbon-helix-helix protein, CopG family [Dehalococcoidia bacterium]